MRQHREYPLRAYGLVFLHEHEFERYQRADSAERARLRELVFERRERRQSLPASSRY